MSKVNSPSQNQQNNQGQKKSHSILESIANVAVGYGVAIVAQIYILPIVDVHIDIRHQLILANWMTLVSVVRSYLLRRAFNWIQIRKTARAMDHGRFPCGQEENPAQSQADITPPESK